MSRGYEKARYETDFILVFTEVIFGGRNIMNSVGE
jgi:hypothetical protein